MKKFLFTCVLICSVAILQSCQQQPETNTVFASDTEYKSFGKEITPEGAISQSEMLAKYQSLQPGDTIQVKFTSEVKEVCQAKGCWMSLALDPETSARVKFKDYEFFVPKNASGAEAIVEGKAFRTTQTIEEQKHLALDAGRTQEEIDAITEPKNTLNFEAEGVLLR